jgi:hypothetical protein
VDGRTILKRTSENQLNGTSSVIKVGSAKLESTCWESFNYAVVPRYTSALE